MKHFVIIFLILPILSYSQIRTDLNRNYCDTIPLAFKLDPVKLREHIYRGIPSNLKHGENQTITYLFADNAASEVCNLIYSGKVYSDWMELENYLNEILKKVIPDELKHDSVIHAYVIQDGNYNAFMTPSGHMFINIGLFDEVTNESAIAGVLAHELGHYYFRHALKYYLEARKGTFEPGLIFENKASSRYSINLELQADSIGMIWLKKSGYNINGMKIGFEIISRLEHNEVSRSANKWEVKETTHPSSKVRLERINSFINSHKDQPGEDFIIDKDKFYKFKEQAKPEILKFLMRDFNYGKCIEKAFKYHIFEPGKIVYISYLMEGIRRECYLDVNKWKELFITSRYYDSLGMDGSRRKYKMKDTLLRKMNYNVLALDSEEAKEIKAKFYWTDKPKFYTYDQAFEFYNRVSIALKDHECYLSNALSYSDDTKARNKLLDTYLSFDDIKHRDFAENLRNDNIYQKLSNKKLLVFDNLQATIKIKKDNILIKRFSSNPRNELACLLDSVAMVNKNRIPLFLPELKKYHLNDYKNLADLERFSFIPIFAKGQRTELFILDPMLWEIFQKYNVNEIEFVNCRYPEYGYAEQSIEDYTKIMNMDYNTVLSKSNRDRLLDTFISSVRIIKDALMKFKYYDGPTKLKNKRPGYSEIISDIDSKLYFKEEKAKLKDNLLKDKMENRHN